MKGFRITSASQLDNSSWSPEARRILERELGEMETSAPSKGGGKLKGLWVSITGRRDPMEGARLSDLRRQLLAVIDGLSKEEASRSHQAIGHIASAVSCLEARLMELG